MLRRTFLALLSASPLAALVRRKPEPEARIGRDTRNVLQQMDLRMRVAAEEGRTPLSFSLGRDARREYVELLTGELGYEPDMAYGELRYRGVPVEAARSGDDWMDALHYGPELAQEEYADPALVHLHTAPTPGGKP